jgi:glycosyltransferase involved in cell wall biosynthesis
LKVALVGPTYPFRGGIVHHTRQLAQHLARRHDLRVYGYRRQYPAWLFPGRSQLDPGPRAESAVDEKAWLIPWQPATWGRVSREFLRWRPDVVAFQWWVTFMAPMTAYLVRSARRAGIGTVVVCHNIVPHESRAFDQVLARAAVGAADRLVVHSPSEGDKARALSPRSPVDVVPFPSIEVSATRAWSRDRARSELNLEGNVLLFFGFVRPYKGLTDLLDALPLVLAEMDASLLIIGEVWGSVEPYLEKIREQGLSSRVRLVNRYVPDNEAAMYFAAADLVVLPYRDATGSAVLQLAFSMGVPVVATRTGSMTQAVQEGVTGHLVNPGDVHAIAGAIVGFFRGGRAEEMRRNIGRQDAQAGWDRLVETITGATPPGRRRSGLEK